MKKLRNDSRRLPSPAIRYDARGCRRLVALLGLASLFVVAPAHGDDPGLAAAPGLTPGMRVRITAPNGADTAVAGTIRSLDGQTIELAVRGRPEPVRVARDQIAKIEVSAGQGSRLSGALIGGLVGAGVGAAVGKGSEPNNGYVVNSAAEAGGAIAFALLGAAIGALIPPAERWQEVSRSSARLSFAPRPDGRLGASFTWAF
jgi:hypothetical protein